MRTRLIGSIAIAALALTACGGDDDGGGGGGSPQDQVADMMIDSINESTDGSTEGFSIDEDCVREVTSKLSDEDAEAIVAAGPDGNPDVSVDAEAIATDLFDCIDIDLSQIDLNE